MKTLVKRSFDIFKIIVLIYLFTLLVFLIDTTKVFIEIKNLSSSLKIQDNSDIRVGKFARDLQRYSETLDSPLVIPPSLLIGDLNSIRSIGRTFNHGAKALEYISPLLDQNLESISITNTQLLASDRKILSKASNQARLAFQEFENLEFTGILRRFDPRLAVFQSRVIKYREVFDRIDPILPIIPELLGSERERTYFVGMQNSAQGRGTGGLLGTFAIISIKQGKISLKFVAPNTALEIQPDIPIYVPDEYRVIYRDYAKSWNGSNFSPHFPYAAQIWAETWRRMTGEKVDGVISVDTYLFRALLAASGPINVDGYLLTKDNVIEELLSNAYKRFENDPTERKNYLAEIAKAVAERFISGSYSKATLIRELIDPLVENRILIYTNNVEEMDLISQSPLSGIFSDTPNNEYRLVIQNIAGNKLDYYIYREMILMSEKCLPQRTTRVDFTVTNTADPDEKLPAYVNALRAQGYPQGKENTQFAGIFLYGPTDSRITGVIDNDTGKTYGSVFTERKRPLYAAQVMIPAGTSKNFSVFFEGGTGKITSYLQPLVIPQDTVIIDSCKL